MDYKSRNQVLFNKNNTYESRKNNSTQSLSIFQNIASIVVENKLKTPIISERKLNGESLSTLNNINDSKNKRSKFFTPKKTTVDPKSNINLMSPQLPLIKKSYI